MTFMSNMERGATVFGATLCAVAMAACGSSSSKKGGTDAGPGGTASESGGATGTGGSSAGGSSSGGATDTGGSNAGGTDGGAKPVTLVVTQTNLVADQADIAPTVDHDLLNPWGLIANPTAGFFWVSDNHSGLATVYSPTGGASVLNVKVPGPADQDGGFMASPSGQVYNGTAADFMGDKFIVDTEDGTISGWQSGTAFVRRVDASATSEYKGLALIENGTKAELLATNFETGKVDAFDGTYAPVASPGFVDSGIPAIPGDFAPFNVASLNGKVYVAYAKQNGDGDDQAGAGNGYVSVFDTDGAFVSRLVSQGVLNSPWALQIAPASFGALAGTLLVGNFGNGAINAYDATTGAPRGSLSDDKGALSIAGLWALVVGPKTATADYSSSVFFTAGPGGEAHGIYGKLDVAAQ